MVKLHSSEAAVTKEAPRGALDGGSGPGDLGFVCPRDQEPLKLAGDGADYTCGRCGKLYPIQQGVVRFLDESDSFYESHYADWTPIKVVPRSERWHHAWRLWFIPYVWSVRKHVDVGSRVVEVGCGSGVAYFGERYQMVGVDIAFSSLTKVVDLYGCCLQVDLRDSIPLPSESVDAVVNSFVWEHIRPEDKPTLLGDWHRILRPKGKLVLVYDVETENPLIRRLKRKDAALYERLYIEDEHHYGYQRPEENQALFEANGFRVLENHGLGKTWIQSPREYVRIGRWPGWPQRLARVGLAFSNPPWLYPYTALVRGVDEFVGPLLPMSWSRFVVSVCERI